MGQVWYDLHATVLVVVTEELCHTSSLVPGVLVSCVHKQHHGETMGMESSCGHSIHVLLSPIEKKHKGKCYITGEL